jgi:cell filamentation protein, protein adenylyltransferase
VPEDPYADPVTGTLRNKLGLTAAGDLEAAERDITHAALIFLEESPVQPSYDLGHLCAIHRRIFGDIYDWAGQLRAVAIAKGPGSACPSTSSPRRRTSSGRCTARGCCAAFPATCSPAG